ncbi:hypothetical protein OH76DRAFT_536269 [Lentinus brumalis]|uniref:Uncharacterized protein n=1 Tax=Lentinus brumalis TaxID=2498619 RepID=A0A371DAK4_9APHY|nr:hypothetical protein OH76DRAFT_536269 [Polyporus brumalis]
MLRIRAGTIVRTEERHRPGCLGSSYAGARKSEIGLGSEEGLRLPVIAGWVYAHTHTSNYRRRVACVAVPRWSPRAPPGFMIPTCKHGVFYSWLHARQPAHTKMHMASSVRPEARARMHSCAGRFVLSLNPQGRTTEEAEQPCVIRDRDKNNGRT